MKVQQKNEQSLIWLYAWALAMLAICYQGYRFNSGDQAEHLPQVYRLLDPELFGGDFFLSLYDQTFTVREYWVWLVYGLSTLVGVKAACFALHVICLWLISYSWIQIGRHLTGSFAAGVAGTFLSLTLLNSFTVGGNNLAGSLFIGSMPAEALASLGVLLYIKDKQRFAFVVLGIATWFQALVGLQWCILLCLTKIAQLNRTHIRQALLYGLLYLLAASPMLVPVLIRQFYSNTSYDKELYYRLLFVNRNMLHYLPSLFPLTDYIKATLLAILAAIFIKTGRAFMLKTGKYWMLIIIFGCIVYSVLLMELQVMAVGKLQWFKTTVWLNVCSSMAIASALVQWKQFNEQWITGIWAQKAVAVLGVAGLLFIFASGYLPSARLNNRYQLWANPATDLQLMHSWIAQHLPKDALVLVPPDDDAFACEAKRPTPVNFKAVVHEPFYFMAWKKSMEDYYQVDFTTLTKQSALPAAIANYRSSRPAPEVNKARYRLDDTGNCDFLLQLGPRIHQQGKWILTEIK